MSVNSVVPTADWVAIGALVATAACRNGAVQWHTNVAVPTMVW
eukprot:COSAG06_NODE_54775_length_293_cov_0.469072_2_plen_42_part_01